MFLSIVKQIKNRWKNNFWLSLELLLVFCLVWYIVDYLFVLNYNRRIPSYIDIENTYRIDIALLPETHPEYDESDSDTTSLIENFYRIVDRIQFHSQVEVVGVSFFRTYPGSGSYNGRQFINPTDTSKFIQTQSFVVAPVGDYFRVFRHTTKEGKKILSMDDIDWEDPKAIVVSKIVEDVLFQGQAAVGKTLTPIRGNSADDLTIKGVMGDLKRFNKDRPSPVVFFFQRISGENIKRADISIRFGKKLSSVELASFKDEMLRELRIGNYHLKEIVSYQKVVDDFNRREGSVIKDRTYMVLILFFLLNILLCVMGTFWYRVNFRREEIGLFYCEYFY